MKHTLACLLLLALSAAAFAQTTAPSKSAASAPKAATAPAKDAAAKGPAQKAGDKAPPKSKAQSASRADIKSTASSMAAGIAAADAALTPGELAIAERVHVGTLPCELGTVVTIAADPKSPGHFDVTAKGARYRMLPVATSTGAIRLEDQRAGAVWLQLGNKSMLMNQKLGQRLADECQSPAQVALAQTLKTNPAPNLLETAPAAASPVRASPVPAAAGVVYPTGPTPPMAK